MEAALRAAIRAGIDESLFWTSTPYNLGMRLQEISRRRTEGYLYTGWFAERFAREQRLEGPQAYIRDMLDGGASVEVQREMAEAELSRMAAAWGLEVVDIEEDDTDA